MTKKFIKNNEPFICENCGHETPPHPKSSRDHCNKCLHSLHVDINPGDRMNQCKGLLVPIGLKLLTNKEQLVYKCKKCGGIVYCISAPDDNREEIIKLSMKIY